MIGIQKVTIFRRWKQGPWTECRPEDHRRFGMRKSAERVSFEPSLRLRNSQFCELSHFSRGASPGPAVGDLVCVDERPTLLAVLLNFPTASKSGYFCAFNFGRCCQSGLLLCFDSFAASAGALSSAEEVGCPPGFKQWRPPRGKPSSIRRR
jgi:hypothetical protein